MAAGGSQLLARLTELLHEPVSGFTAQGAGAFATGVHQDRDAKIAGRLQNGHRIVRSRAAAMHAGNSSFKIADAPAEAYAVNGRVEELHGSCFQHSVLAGKSPQVELEELVAYLLLLLLTQEEFL